MTSLLRTEREPESPDVAAAQLAAAVGALWDKYRDAVFARVDVVEEAARALAEDRLHEELRRRAEHEAHKLAGAVGGFGFAEASRLARQAEDVLAESPAPAPGQAQRLMELAAAIRAELERPLPR